jgi:hypothetical protein
MVHFVERHHNDRFVSIMDNPLPRWTYIREELNAVQLGQSRGRDGVVTFTLGLDAHDLSQITVMLLWLSISSRRLDRTHIEAFVAQLGQEIRADLLAMLSGRQKFFHPPGRHIRSLNGCFRSQDL